MLALDTSGVGQGFPGFSGVGEADGVAESASVGGGCVGVGVGDGGGVGVGVSGTGVGVGSGVGEGVGSTVGAAVGVAEGVNVGASVFVAEAGGLAPHPPSSKTIIIDESRKAMLFFGKFPPCSPTRLRGKGYTF